MSNFNVEAFINGLHEYLEKQFSPVLKRLATLESQINTMAQSKYMGTHQSALEYKKGNMVTHAGSLWTCCQDCSRQKPGTGTGWQLTVKGGH